MANVLEKSTGQFMHFKNCFSNSILASKKSNVIYGADDADYASTLLAEPEGKSWGYSEPRDV